ncbi:putative membrane protein [Prauserella shujinwangii]|uniref:Putative membrane protein n=1 Tax=Prauserella shujinwangii TaxID=1453103 RepID=A0A2T0LKY7_9PSEU|nr:putative membrane protein [Prauserella shujinwangii]
MPAGLLALSLVPVAASGFRVTELATGADITEANARFFDAPVPILVHVVAASVFCVAGAFQFSPALRRKRPRWHRASGRVLVLCGLATALSALWMTLFSAIPEDDRGLLTVFRLLFASAMAAAIVLAFLAIRRGNVARHRAWMIRGYALGLGAGTQVFTALAAVAFLGTVSPRAHALAMGAAWVINLAVAEWAIRGRGVRPAPALKEAL